MLYFQKQGVHGIYLYNLTNKQLSEGKKLHLLLIRPIYSRHQNAGSGTSLYPCPFAPFISFASFAPFAPSASFVTIVPFAPPIQPLSRTNSMGSSVSRPTWHFCNIFSCFCLCFHLFSYLFVDKCGNKRCRATAVLRTPRFAHFSFPHLHISPSPSLLPHISRFSLLYFSNPHLHISPPPSSAVFPFFFSFVFLLSTFAYFYSPKVPFSLLAYFYYPSLPRISLCSLSHFSIPEQMDHTRNFLDFYLCRFPNGFLAKTNRLYTYH